MTTVVNLKRLLDRKQWEMCNFPPVASGAASFTVTSTLHEQYTYFFAGSSMYIYDPFEDAWMSQQATGFTVGAGTCGCFHPWGPTSAVASGSTTSVIQTNMWLQRSGASYTIRFISGINAGIEATIKNNTVGTGSVITLTAPLPSAPATGDQFILMTGRVWVYVNGTITSSSLKYFDNITNSWGGIGSTTPTTGTWGTEGRLVSTASANPTDYLVSGTATGGTTTTLVNSSKTWLTNNWAGSMVRIISGTCAGQYRTITSNTSTTLTLATAWAGIPDTTSVYQIEGNSDSLYLLGDNSTATYRFSISNQAWTTLAARSGAAVAGCSAHWVNHVANTDWTDENNTLGSGYLNGRYIYSFRGGSSTIDVYDIAMNVWSNSITYTPDVDVVTSGTGYAYVTNYIYAMQPSPLGRVIKFNIYENRMEPCSQVWYAQGSVVGGDRLFFGTFTDGTTTINYLYNIMHSAAVLLRMLIF